MLTTHNGIDAYDWDFLARHHHQLKSQGRMSLILAHLDRISTAELKKICQKAADCHAKIT